MTGDAAREVLAGMLVLDLSQLITGPWCTSLLGDLGAEVIKVESPRTGDVLRHLGPKKQGEGILFLSVNRNKRSLTLDLSNPQGRRVLDRLVAKADVLVQNFRPDVRRAYGLEYENLRLVKPDLILLSVTAFGEDGPYALQPGTDHVFQGLSGLMSLSGEAGGEPMRCGVPVADMTAAMLSYSGVLAALLHRQLTGHGQEIKLNLLDAAMSLQQTTLTEYLLLGRQSPCIGNSSPFACPVGVFKTRDGSISISAFNDKFWCALCRALGQEGLLDDPRFQGHEQRMAHRAELETLLEQRLAQDDTAQWLHLLQAADVPCGPVHDYASLVRDPQVQRNGLVRDLPHDTLGTVRTLGNPLALGATPARAGQAAPVLGRHSEQILREFNFDHEQIQRLSSEGII
ncbi:MAG: CoA transferase [Proteobacteria bacterium]|nr:CoA transferase [Pseudomonadota bacterium]MBU4573108.1 CoA transferase [Pseudomonadota bacterium]MBU4597087.1 CoA transferase [Pseudomonadota bacterium]MBV1715329.1 CoA transferase [Desulfarculus sp.]